MQAIISLLVKLKIDSHTKTCKVWGSVSQILTIHFLTSDMRNVPSNNRDRYFQVIVTEM